MDLKKLIVKRIGNLPDSSMITTKISGVINPHQTILVVDDELKEISAPIPKMNIPVLEKPKSVIIKGEWCEHKCEDIDDSNILGISCGLFTKEKKIKIPTEDSTLSLLSYYGCKLVKHFDIISFDTPKPIPQCYVEIGKKYVEGYIYGKEKGVYLEWHNTPHFHMPLNKEAGGYLVIGKKTKENEFELTAFNIPYGYGVYMPPYTIHNDLFLTGKYLVCYTTTDHYSTVVIKEKGINEIIEVSIG